MNQKLLLTKPFKLFEYNFIVLFTLFNTIFAILRFNLSSSFNTLVFVGILVNHLSVINWVFLSSDKHNPLYSLYAFLMIPPITYVLYIQAIKDAKKELEYFFNKKKIYEKILLNKTQNLLPK